MKKLLHILLNILPGRKEPNHRPGSFLGDETYPSTLTLEQRQRFGLGEKLIEFDPDELSEILPSENLMDAFQSMKAMTFPKIAALNDKRSSVVELRKSGVIQNIPQGEMVYIGSGDDIEYPLLLGGTNIVLVDPLFQIPVHMRELIQRIEEIIEGQVLQKDAFTLVFPFSFDRVSCEPVTVRIVPKYANIGAHQSSDVYEPSGDIAFLLGFASGGYLDEDERLLRTVVTNGYVYGPIDSDDTMKSNKFSAIEVLTAQTFLYKKTLV